MPTSMTRAVMRTNGRMRRCPTFVRDVETFRHCVQSGCSVTERCALQTASVEAGKAKLVRQDTQQDTPQPTPVVMIKLPHRTRQR